MAKCDKCGNDYDKSFRLETHDGKSYVFDSFECAISVVAPRCSHCNCTIIGHGLESDGEIYCCAHCGRKSGEDEFIDRVD